MSPPSDKFNFRVTCDNNSLSSIAGEIITFYTIFYLCLAAFCVVCLKGLMYTIDENVPKWRLDASLIGTNPGLGFRPIAENGDQGSLIWYDSSNKAQIRYWTKLIDKFLDSKWLILSESGGYDIIFY